MLEGMAAAHAFLDNAVQQLVVLASEDSTLLEGKGVKGHLRFSGYGLKSVASGLLQGWRSAPKVTAVAVLRVLMSLT